LTFYEYLTGYESLSCSLRTNCDSQPCLQCFNNSETPKSSQNLQFASLFYLTDKLRNIQRVEINSDSIFVAFLIEHFMLTHVHTVIVNNLSTHCANWCHGKQVLQQILVNWDNVCQHPRYHIRRLLSMKAPKVDTHPHTPRSDTDYVCSHTQIIEHECYDWLNCAQLIQQQQQRSHVYDYPTVYRLLYACQHTIQTLIIDTNDDYDNDDTNSIINNRYYKGELHMPRLRILEVPRYYDTMPVDYLLELEVQYASDHLQDG
jgi:hypothetical protein